LAAVVEKLAQYRAKALELVKAKLAAGEMEQIDQQVEAKMHTILNEQFGKLRESLDSTLAPTPSGSSGACAKEPSATAAP
jgi:non-homologous end joining protein Ku